MLCYIIQFWEYIKDSNHIPVTLPAFLLLLKNVWEALKMAKGYFKRRKEKKEENIVFSRKRKKLNVGKGLQNTKYQ